MVHVCCKAAGCNELQSSARMAEEAAKGSAEVSFEGKTAEEIDGGGGAVLACVPVDKVVCVPLEAAWDAKLQIGARMADDAAGGSAEVSTGDEEADTDVGEGGAEPG